jgi:transcriptional regulator GlxA family with amidase domain
MTSPSLNPRRITIVGYPDVQALDVTGPHEVFSLANRFAGDGSPAYELELVARTRDGDRTVRTSSGMRLGIDRVVRGRPGALDRRIDTLVVAGGAGTAEAAVDRELLRWLRSTAPSCRRVASVCSGAFVLAAAGLLDGRRATTHWSECDQLQALFPAVRVESDPIFVRDGNVTTSAGITAGMDLALALVEEDLGREVALAVSRWLVMFVQRSGGQSQFSSQLADQLAERRPLRDLQGWILDHPDADLSVAALAARVAMSPRHFARVFTEEVGTTPARYVEGVRVDHARRLLESSSRSIDEIARATGFGTVETLQRSFRRRLRITPGDYRRHFSRAGGPVPPTPARPTATRGALHV